MERGTKNRSSGIAERLAALQKNGEENWKKKVPKLNPENPVLDILNSNVMKPVVATKILDNDADDDDGKGEVVRLRKTENNRHSQNNNGRPVSIVDRLSKLQVAQNNWQTKVGEKDAGKFTVAGKMQRDGKALSLQPASPRSRSRSRTPTRNGQQTEPAAAAGEGGEERVKMTPKARTIRGEAVVASATATATPIRPRPMSTPLMLHETSSSNRTSLSAEDGKTITVPKMDTEDLEQFFAPTSSGPTPESTSTIVEEDLDLDLIVPTERSSILSMPKKTVRVATRNRKSRNPVKQLAQRTDLRESYTETATGVGDKEFKRKNVEKASKHSHLAVEALAGLASTEDFSSVQLRKGNSVRLQSNLVPYKDDSVMLLQIKGRRFCQTRLVSPTYKSVNSGDAYILLTSKEIYNWQGKFSNVIERSRSADVASMIWQKKDLGCKSAKKIYTLEEEKCFGSSRPEREFWQHLGAKDGDACPKPAGPPEEDEEYEVEVSNVNMAWEVCIDNGVEELKPLESFWGSVPKYEMLDPTKVLVIDFGPEVYAWNGKSASFDLRKAGGNLAKKVWKEPCSAADSHPILRHEADPSARPAWGFVGKVNQHMETMLFREKFLDWPEDTERVIRIKEDVKKMVAAVSTNTGEIDVASFDADVMASWTVEDPNLQMEGSYLGRGRGYYDVEERRQYEIETLSLKTWHVNEYDISPLPDEWQAQFHTEDTYVVRWIYKVSLTGRDLKGNPSKHMAVGRERCAYFFWQGTGSRVTEKGASALMTVELDRENGPQTRVDEGREDAAFLNLWAGAMTVHQGKRGGSIRGSQRLFVVRGETPEETCLVQVEAYPSSLRSVGVFILFDRRSSRIHIWLGESAPDHVKEMARSRAEKIAKAPPSEMGFSSASVSVVEEAEGSESSEFKQALGMEEDSHSSSYWLGQPAPEQSPRLFYMTAVSGVFEVTEVLCPFRRTDVLNTMPFNQQDLYGAEQPGLFLLDVGGERCWLWQGWWPDNPSDADNANTITGSGMIRWHAERRAAMQTAVDFMTKKYGRVPSRAELVWAGHEPLQFTSLFPSWVERDDVKMLNQQYVNPDSSLLTTLAALSRSEYSWEELLKRPLPDGVDPAKLESYLSDSEFQTHLGLTREEFSCAPRWKQLEIRKEKGLF